MGDVELDETLKTGECRELTEEETQYLKNFIKKMEIKHE